MNIKRKIELLPLIVLLCVGVPASYSHAAEPEGEDVVNQLLSESESEGFAGSYLSGQFAKDSGDITSAIYYLRRVHQEKPNNLDIARQLHGMLLLEGDTEEAVVLANHIHKLDKKDALSNLILALKSIKNKEPQKALELLEASSDAGRVQLWEPLITAWLDVENERLDKALMINQLNIDATRIMPLVNYHLALINSEAGFKNEAADNFKQAIENPKDPPDRIMSQLLTFYDKTDKPEVLTALVESYRQAHPDRKEGAPQIVTTRDGVGEILYTMGGIMLSAGMSNDAAIYQQLALYIKPEFPEAALTLADAYSELQQYDKANTYYAKIDRKSIYYKKAQLHIAINEERSDRLDEALTKLDELDKRFPADMEAMVTKGDLLRIHSRFDEAVASYTVAIDRIVEPKSMYWPVFFARGSCYERLNRWHDAENDLKKALELKPDQPDVLNYLAYGWLERGQNQQEARGMIQRAFKARPDDAEIVDSMGWSLYLEGDYANATRYLEKAVELLPNDPTVNDHLGDVYWRVGRKTEARFQWERSLSFSPDDKLLVKLHQKLKEGLVETEKTTSVSANQRPVEPLPSAIP
jgi:tetratricopeptide (TPR) repeat protein